MSYSVNLRKMSLKSTIGFGKYADMIVGNVIKVEPTYLAWLYFNKAKISFLDEILTELKIEGEFIIDKPGTEPNLMFKWKDHYYGDDEELRLKHWHVKNQQAKAAKSRHKAMESKKYSKGSLMNYNHGRKKL